MITELINRLSIYLNRRKMLASINRGLNQSANGLVSNQGSNSQFANQCIIKHLNYRPHNHNNCGYCGFDRFLNKLYLHSIGKCCANHKCPACVEPTILKYHHEALKEFVRRRGLRGVNTRKK